MDSSKSQELVRKINKTYKEMERQQPTVPTVASVVAAVKKDEDRQYDKK